MPLWIPKKWKKHLDTESLFVKPNDPWYIPMEDLTLDNIIKEYNHVTIYDARWRKYQRVCVKRLCADQYDIIRRELDILTMCAHPSVCQFFGVGQDDTYVYYVFEYMDLGNLEEYISICGNLSEKQRLNILISVATGLQYLSSRQPLYIIHRDFKPSNILINKHGEAKISDFGISKYLKNNNNKKPMELIPSGSLQKLFELSQNNTMDILGTVRWTAPEVLCENRYNHACDIFSFGLVAHFVWTQGNLPYDQEYSNHGAKITYAKSQNNRPFLDNLCIQTETDQHMYHLIKSCTETNINLRPPSAEAIVQTLVELTTSI